MSTHQFWMRTFERAVKTFAQSLLAILGVSGVGLLNAPWITALSTAGMAALLSVLMSVTSEPWGERGTPSVLSAAVPGPQPAPKTMTRT